MAKRRTCGLASKRVFLAGAALALFLFGGPPSGAQEARDQDGFLVGMLFKAWTARGQVAADAKASEQAIQANDKAVEEADRRMTAAMQSGNDQAIFDARGGLMDARADKKKLKQARARLDLAKAAAEASFAAVKDLLVSGQAKGPDLRICGLVSLQAGKADLVKKDGKKSGLAGGRPVFLEPGDEIVTMAGGTAEVWALDGRAAARLGERSRLKIEESGPQEQGLRLVQGKAYFDVGKGADFAKALRDNAEALDADQNVKEAVARAIAQIEGWTGRKLALRTPSGCCSLSGAKAGVELMKNGETDIAVFEGAAEAGDANCTGYVPVGQGFKAVVGKAGVSGPQKIAGLDKWWEK